MASPELDPLAGTDENGDKFDDNFDTPANLSLLTEKDLNLIKKMQMMNSLPVIAAQPKPNGRMVTNRTLPEILCTCPQKCDDKVPLKVRTYMFKYYHALARERPKQESLLLRYIEMKSLTQRLKEDNKRVQCRYKAPVSMKAIEFIFDDDSVILSDDEANENEPKKKKAKLDLSKEAPPPKPDQMTVLRTDPSITYRIDKNGNTEVCQKAYMNVFLVPEKRVRAVREKLVASKRIIMEQEMAQRQVSSSELETAVMIAQDLAAGCKPLLQMLSGGNAKAEEEENGFDISGQLLNAIDSDIELVNNFFYNQLWKPEMFEFASPRDKPAKKIVNGNVTLNNNSGAAKPVNNTSSSALLDETFDSVINASGSQVEESEADSTVNNTMDGSTANNTVDYSTANTTANESNVNNTVDFSSANNTVDYSTANEEASVSPMDTDDSPRDPLASPEDLEVQAVTLNNTAAPLNLHTNGGGGSGGSPDSLSSRTSPDSTLSKQSGRSSSTTMSNGKSSSGVSRASTVYADSMAAMDLTTSGVQRGGSGSGGGGGGKSRSSLNGSSHRSEPMRQNSSQSSPSIQNILNNAPHLLPAALFDPDLSKYLSGLESSISITAPPSRKPSHSSSGRSSGSSGGNSSRQRRNHSVNAAATLTAQLIQSALSQGGGLSVTASGAGSPAARYNQSSLNQILNIPDSVSITPTLVNNSKS